MTFNVTLKDSVAAPCPAADPDELVRTHLHLAKFAVSSVATRVPSHVSRDDLTAAANLALVTASRRYDPAGDATFSTYALPRLEGAVLDELRKHDWSSRTVRTQARQAEAAHDALAAELGRPPTRSELAGRLGVDTSTLDRLHYNVHRSVIMSISAESVSPLAQGTEESAEATVLARERNGYLLDAMMSLPDRLREVIERNFFGEESLKDIAEHLGVTESRVSQMRSQALRLVHAAMSTHVDGQAVPEPAGSRARKQHQQYLATVASRTDYRARFTTWQQPSPVPQPA